MEWTPEEAGFLSTFSDPYSIQEYLDSIEYNPNEECRSPRWVIRNRRAHCFEGALFAAAVLEFLGYQPLIVDMMAVKLRNAGKSLLEAGLLGSKPEGLFKPD